MLACTFRSRHSSNVRCHHTTCRFTEIILPYRSLYRLGKQKEQLTHLFISSPFLTLCMFFVFRLSSNLNTVLSLFVQRVSINVSILQLAAFRHFYTQFYYTSYYFVGIFCSTSACPYVGCPDENPKVVCGSVLTVKGEDGDGPSNGASTDLIVLGRRNIRPRRGFWGIPAGTYFLT